MTRFLEMHMYVTSALQRTDMKSVFLQMAMDLLHKKVTCQYMYVLYIDLAELMIYCCTVSDAYPAPVETQCPGYSPTNIELYDYYSLCQYVSSVTLLH